MSVHISPVEACMKSGFCCRVDSTTGHLVLKEHKSKGKWQSVADLGAILLCIQTRVLMWKELVLMNAFGMINCYPNSFYDNCVVPEIVSPVHALGIPMRHLSKV